MPFGSRKGAVEWSVAMVGIELVILLLALFTLNKVVSNVVQPHFQVAYANAELLRSTIDRLCEQGSGSETIENWNFPQPRPFVINAGPVEIGKNILPKFMIKAYGDPHFLLYYEAFPPPQAVAWEAYQSSGERLVAILHGDEFDSNRITEARQKIEERLANLRVGANVSTVVFSNIVLDDRTKTPLPGSAGNWKKPDFYSLQSPELMPETERSLVKYRACGDYTLCMKTREGIIKLPLPNCAKRKIDYIQMYRSKMDVLESIAEEALKTGTRIDVNDPELMDATGAAARLVALGSKVLPKVVPRLVGRAVVAIAIIQMLSSSVDLMREFVKLFYSTESDFALASPCGISMDISVSDCSCNAMQKAKLFEYDASRDVLEAKGEYVTCWDRVEGASGETASVPCISISLRDAKQFCRSQNTLLSIVGTLVLDLESTFSIAAKYDQTTGNVKLLDLKSQQPGFFAGASEWLWPGVW